MRVCVLIKLPITAQSGPVILVILHYSHWSSLGGDHQCWGGAALEPRFVVVVVVVVAIIYIYIYIMLHIYIYIHFPVKDETIHNSTKTSSK